ncbi:MAG: methylated-DNA--[protein]-cysteine S-methyltransferase [Candidatus Kapaibacterium sp.]|nr:MAG: methylated-DNA--[protein]-cysteine S-methyltransferase [Candidatus Kapabacteria bacterium]
MAATLTMQSEITVSVKETLTILQEASYDALWRAVLAKDRRYDGVFWFAVKTTGIYCRPSCSSRTPLEQNVAYFLSPEEAHKHGFRACKRCSPDQIGFPDANLELVQKICAFIARQITENPDESVSLEAIGAEVALRGDHAQRTFTSVLGISPKEFADAFRLNRFKSLVKSSATVAEAMHEAGYGSSSRLYEKADVMLGMTPASYKKNGKGAVMYVEVRECKFDYVLIAATDKGICSVQFAYDPCIGAEFIGEMEEAIISTNHPQKFWEWCDTILEFIETMNQETSDALLSLPLDIQVSAFQAQVWSALRAIPCGETRSYSEIAEEIGKPSASRAVASACASNPVALINPCHRVIRAGGDVSGYRWGVERKKKILTGEKKGV